MNPEEKVKMLEPPDQQRLDQLLNYARKYNHTAFLLAGTSIILTMLGELKFLVLSFGDIGIPKLHASVIIYFLVIIAASISKYFSDAAFPLLALDVRIVPFAWIPVIAKKPSKTFISIWTLIPLTIGAIAAAVNLNLDKQGMTLLIMSLLLFLLPKHIQQHIHCIVNKSDHRGGPATFSIFIYQYYQIFKIVYYIFFLYLPILAIIPEWRNAFMTISKYSIVLFFSTIIIRFICGLPFIYRKIDKFGVRFGFPQRSMHYR